MKKIVLTSISFAIASTIKLWGVPVNPTPYEVTLPDGTVQTVTPVGDEYFHYFLTEDGKPVIKENDGFFYHLGSDEKGELVNTKIKAFSPEGKEFVKSADFTLISEAIKSANISQRNNRKIKANAYGYENTSFPTKGELRGIAVLVEYQDKKFTIPDPLDSYTRMLNEEGYSDYDATGSARDWYLASSNGQFQPTWDVYGPITLDREESYYGANSAGWASDVRPYYMAIEACQQLDDTVDFTIYDNDGDGFIDNIYIFYAGYGENSRYGSSSGVWPHSSDVCAETGQNYEFDGVILNHYACNQELNDGKYMDGIGVFCHEFSHVLGLPDLYDRAQSFYTCGRWDTMCQGPYNNLNRTPPLLSSPERYLLGWIEPREITGDPQNVILDFIGSNDACYIQTENEYEFFFFENRQQIGWDAYIPGHGMLVWHLDLTPGRWTGHFVNSDPNHQCLDLVEADGNPFENTTADDAFPLHLSSGYSKTDFTDEGRPNMKSWAGEPQNKPITQITEDLGMIYFKVCGGVDEILPVEAYEAKDITSESFLASWSEAYKGCEYILSVFSKDESGEPVYVKGYEKRYAGTLSQVNVMGLEGSTTYYYRVTAYDPGFKIYSELSNVIEVTTLPNEDAGMELTVENPSDVEYYNMQGIRIDNPAPGQILIMKKGKTTRKVRI